MPQYRYLNRDHSLVLRDDHVIAWDAKADTPVDPQPSVIVQTSADMATARPAIEPKSERKLWQDAGSPKPAEFTINGPRLDVPTPERPPTTPPWEDEDRPWLPMMLPIREEPEDQLQAIDKIEAEVRSSNDIVGLKRQVEALAEILRTILGGRRMKEPT